ncbi:rod shape-determining protein MreC [Paraburkholderia caballeronis]|uniref:Cell shape-determining protein MreC n=1 Tax=Paraburkholderia caballeronis TaxID=416943 RepID=A0A1H7HD43_9BURK|nr:rod shape-determining protein MreC [Paraburkholderia caballeronis]PXW29555.1 rod shape-determining protein MreC [Paraburkholderia caballeronis]PXX04814.1 rod shape-determining protein MreC [Paraburkholderia caballeronis]RAK05875.1 rod shape-determining protein MreC [Paraburkholderia caballeronis]SEB42688.1 rod shape-determining protein MreC [Paraburkholderia caballeronis]SEK48204.1 rod shape-determining protein MreC [Paraburkholderia caballeronis]
MEYSPPPLFKQGPSALARLIFFVVLSLVLLISDARFNTLEIVRGVLGAGLYPLQRAALVPRDLFMGAADLAVTSATLRADNAQLRSKNLQLSQQANQAVALDAENAHLRALLQLSQRIAAQAMPAEIEYDTRDPFTQKVVIGRGAQQGIANGSPVVDENGVIGQITRVFPLQAEVTLITDKDQAVPVEIVRTGLRSVIYGTPKGDLLDLRFVPISADVQVGDELVTSGLDGIYPQGLPVAKVLRVDKLADTAFARVVCVPLAAVRGARQMLVLHYEAKLPPRPADEETAADAKKKAVKAADKAKAADANAKPADAKAADAKAADGNAKPADTGSAAKPASGAQPAATPAQPAAKPATAKPAAPKPAAPKRTPPPAAQEGQ